MDANRVLSARDVCDRIQEKLPPMLERHNNPMASVTTVLNRLVASGEARAVALENGRRAWKWIADSEPAGTVPDQKSACVNRSQRPLDHGLLLT